MKITLRIIAHVVLPLALLAWPGVCSAAGGLVVARTSFHSGEGAEVLLIVRLATPGYEWKDGPWDPPLEVSVDGVLLSSLVPFRGSGGGEYVFLYGPAGEGDHEATLADPAAPRGVSVESFDVKVVCPGDPDHNALRYAPVLLGRPENTGSDVPLLMWVEEKKEPRGALFSYSVVWSNEDGGTPTSELMARYGRTVDIEWIYSALVDGDGKILSATYQAQGHETREFNGKMRGDHPILRTCTKNNMVCDSGDSPLVFSYAPVRFESPGVRDRMLDLHPWIYRVAHEELVRENKTARVVPDFIYRVDDSRRYALVDFETDMIFPVGVEVALKLRGDEIWRTADLGVEGMLLARPGHARVGIWTPKGTRIGDVEAVRFSAAGGPGGWFTLVSAGGLVFLDGGFRPVEKDIPLKSPRRISAGSPLVIRMPD